MKQDLTFHVNCVLFYGKNEKNKFNLLSAVFAQRVVKVKVLRKIEAVFIQIF